MSQDTHDAAESVPKPEISVSVERDGMEAWLRVTPPSPVPLVELEARIQQGGITHGIDPTLLRQVAESPTEARMLIARGTPPQPGENARIEYLFQEQENVGSGSPSDEARIDFRENHVTQALQGQVLARKIPATEGIPGSTVTGQVMPSKPGADLALIVGKNVTLSQDQLEAIAGINGLPMFEGGKLTVIPAYTVEDVDFSTGSIAFQGSVIIKGNVLSGFSVVSTANIEVHGFVEGGTLRAVGSIEVKGGVRNKAVLEADRIQTRYVDTSSTLKALGDLRIDKDAVQSTLEAGGKISVGQRLIGGHASAGVQIEAGQIGHPSETPTHVEIQLFKGGKQPEELQAEIDQLRTVLAAVEARLQEARANPNPALGKLIQQEIALGLAIKQLELQQKEPGAAPQIVVKGEVYPGVQVTLHRSTLHVAGRLTGKVFRLSEGEIAH
jgi:uncharacterized protein (DUF342 family)